MSELRQKMIDAMRQRGYSVRTHKSYICAVADLARYYRRSPDRLNAEEVKSWLRHLAVERGLSGASCRQYSHAARFLYVKVLGREDFELKVDLPKRPQRIPELLTRNEVARILAACNNEKHHTILTLCYGCGLRVSELSALRVRHIDGERKLVRIEQAKGAKDRMVPVGPALLDCLRNYYAQYRPGDWLFPHSHRPEYALTISTCQRIFKRAKAKAEIDKIGGIHSLRHAYATHQLATGLPLPELQRAMGHADIRTTLHYLHWIPSYHERQGEHDLVGLLPTLEEE